MEERDRVTQNERIEPESSQADQKGKFKRLPSSCLNLPSPGTYPVGAMEGHKMRILLTAQFLFR